MLNFNISLCCNLGLCFFRSRHRVRKRASSGLKETCFGGHKQDWKLSPSPTAPRHLRVGHKDSPFSCTAQIIAYEGISHMQFQYTRAQTAYCENTLQNVTGFKASTTDSK